MPVSPPLFSSLFAWLTVSVVFLTGLATRAPIGPAASAAPPGFVNECAKAADTFSSTEVQSPVRPKWVRLRAALAGVPPVFRPAAPRFVFLWSAGRCVAPAVFVPRPSLVGVVELRL